MSPHAAPTRIPFSLPYHVCGSHVWPARRQNRSVELVSVPRSCINAYRDKASDMAPGVSSGKDESSSCMLRSSWERMRAQAGRADMASLSGMANGGEADLPIGLASELRPTRRYLPCFFWRELSSISHRHVQSCCTTSLSAELLSPPPPIGTAGCLEILRLARLLRGRPGGMQLS